MTTRTATLTAVSAGLLLAFALPPWGWWPLAIVGVALFDRVLAAQPPWSRFRRSWLVMAACFTPSLLWIGAFTPPGYLIAVAVYASITATLCTLVPPTAPGRWLALPAALVLAEGIRSRWPFGGVPVATFALGQVGGPLVGVARVGGPLLLGLATTVLGVAVAAAVARSARAAGGAFAVVALLGVLAAVAPRGHDIGTLRIAVVQGGGAQGTRLGDIDPAIVFQRHLDASAQIAPRSVDLVLWPEDVIDVEGPVVNSDEGQQIAALARRLHTPVLVGAVEGDLDDPTRFRNAQVAFDADGNAVDRYEKVRRVPFGEYVPFRSLLEHFAGGELAERDALVGHDPPTLTIPGVAKVGVSISWEIFFADRTRAAIGDGGEVLLNPTNGASFSGDLLQAQQLGSSRLRAIETGRWVVQAAPTGFSAIIAPDGHVEQRTAISEQRVLQGDVQRRAGLTWATRVGDWPAVLVSFLLLVLAWLVRGRETGRGT
ncbi:MAG: apolipoprotein N-acyltransferase [Acidimicrobiaceae bacterium]